jgi:hypothetical protein
MKHNHWKPTSLKLFNKVLACKNSETNELASASKYGEIYEFSGSLVGCIVRSPIAAKRVAKLANNANFEPIKAGEEALFKLPLEKLDQLVKSLKIKKNRSSMAKVLNNV